MEGERFDHAYRAAKAFMAANRCNDPRQAAALRAEAYKLLDIIEEERSGAQSSELVGGWAKVLPLSERARTPE